MLVDCASRLGSRWLLELGSFNESVANGANSPLGPLTLASRASALFGVAEQPALVVGAPAASANYELGPLGCSPSARPRVQVQHQSTFASFLSAVAVNERGQTVVGAHGGRAPATVCPLVLDAEHRVPRPALAS